MQYEKKSSAPKKTRKNSSVAANSELFILDNTLQVFLRSLRKALESDSNVLKALRLVLENLYFPSQEQRNRGFKQPISVFPLLQYLSFIFIADEGNYLPIHRIPPLLAQQQYCIRLRGLRAINREVAGADLEGWKT